jgi:hypothetical protein
MEKLKQTTKFKIYKVVKRRNELDVEGSFEELEEFIKDFVVWDENNWSEFVKRINWLLTKTVEDHTSNDTLSEHETGSVHTNLGASGAVTLTLPTVSRPGIIFTFCVQAAQELRIDPGAKTIRDDSGQTADKYKSANAIGECLKIISNENGDWYSVAKIGTWTEEA